MPYNKTAVPQFEGLRQRQQNRNLAQTKTADDAMKRKFASMGASNSGAAVKASQNLLDQSARQNEEAMQGIDFAEAQESSRQTERGQDLGFRDQQFGMAKDQFQFQKDQAQVSQGQFDRELEMKKEQMAMDSAAQNFNMGMARDAAQQSKKGIVGSILGGGGVMGTVGEVFGGGGKFFCTELYLRRLATAREMILMAQFFFRCMWSDTSTCYFYAMNGHKIVEAANKHDFDWGSVKKAIITDIIDNMVTGKIQISKLLYKYQIMTLCLTFEETKGLYDPKSLETTMIDRITKLPRLMFTKTFWRAFKIWFSSLQSKRMSAWE